MKANFENKEYAKCEHCKENIDFENKQFLYIFSDCDSTDDKRVNVSLNGKCVVFPRDMVFFCNLTHFEIFFHNFTEGIYFLPDDV